MTLLILAAAFLASLVGTIYVYLKYRHSYWHRHNIPYIHPTLLFGNLRNLLFFRTSFGNFFQQLYADPSLCNEPVVGFYVLHTPALLIRDPSLIRLILVKEFSMFPNRYEAADPLHDPMGVLSLPLSKHDVWHESRKRISQLFTSGHLKAKIYPNLMKIAEDLENFIERRCKYIADHAAVIEVREMCALYTTDATAALVFSTHAHGLKNGQSDIRKQCQDLLQPDFFKAVHFFIIFFLPHFTHIIRPKVFSEQYANYMRQLVTNTMRSREGQAHNFGDLIDVLMKFQKVLTKEKCKPLCHSDFIASQAAIFVLAGFETSSSVMAFILYELSRQSQIQGKLRAEIKTYYQAPGSNTGYLSYKQVNEMPYLHMVVAEGLRLYPTAPFINRECVPIHNGHGLSLKPLVNFTIPSGMPAYISILGLHRDPKYWSNPTLFNPERFSPEKINEIHPMTYLPFGGGPHGCIGSRVGLLQVKMGLIHILKNYRIESCVQTISEIRFDPKSFMLQAQEGIYLQFVKDDFYK